MNKKALYFDFDGTLWFGRYGEKTLAALKKAHGDGHLIFYNSGRSKAHTDFKLLSAVPFDGFLLGGCHIIVGGKDVFRRDMTEEEVFATVEATEKYGLSTYVEGVENNYYPLLPFGDSPPEIQLPISDFKRLYKTHPGSKLTIFKEKRGEEFLPMPDGAKEIFGRYFDVIDFPAYTECLIKGYGKDFMMKKTEELFGIAHGDTYAFGDSFNDLPMLAYAAFKAVMPHAPEAVRKIADFVATEEENGVAEALRFFGIA